MISGPSERTPQTQSIRITIPVELVNESTFTPWQITMLSWDLLSSCHSAKFETKEKNRILPGRSFTEHALHGWRFLEEAMNYRNKSPLFPRFEGENHIAVPPDGDWSFEIPNHIATDVPTGEKFKEINPVV